MLVQVIHLLEVFATLACIHSIYGKKIRWDIKPIVLCLSLLVILGFANFLQDGGIYSWLVYVPIIIYCKYVFDSSLLQIFVKMIWLMILLTAIEFICMLIVLSFNIENVLIRNVITNFLVLFIAVFILPRLHINKVILRGRLAKFILGSTALVILLLVLQGKVADKINVTLFIIVIPVLLILLYILVKWSTSQEEVNKIKREFEVVNKMDKKYTELVDDIRIKQHGFKNHITAILSAHYTYKTYEKLVEVQDEYCNKLMQENRYNNLLMISDKVLVGFLYDKFREIDDDGIEIRYEINTSVEKHTIPTYYLIEILGILLDNVVEAVKKTEKRCIIFIVSENNDRYSFLVRNVSEYISYADIESWFQKGVSSKGENRGLGLYHIKELCREIECDIYCRNIEYEKDNWIEFCLEIGKADRE